MKLTLHVECDACRFLLNFIHVIIPDSADSYRFGVVEVSDRSPGVEPFDCAEDR